MKSVDTCASYHGCNVNIAPVEGEHRTSFELFFIMTFLAVYLVYENTIILEVTKLYLKFLNSLFH